MKRYFILYASSTHYPGPARPIVYEEIEGSLEMAKVVAEGKASATGRKVMLVVADEVMTATPRSEVEWT